MELATFSRARLRPVLKTRHDKHRVRPLFLVDRLTLGASKGLHSESLFVTLMAGWFGTRHE